MVKNKLGVEKMLKLNIPGRGEIEIENVVFDFNGTLAVDGLMADTTRKMLLELKELVNIYVLTADTYGTVEKQCEGLGIAVKTFLTDNAGRCKLDIIKSLGGSSSMAVGNGFNDILMFKESCISVAVIEGEGCNGKLLAEADIVVKAIADVFGLLLNKNRIKATLRD